MAASVIAAETCKKPDYVYKEKVRLKVEKLAWAMWEVDHFGNYI